MTEETSNTSTLATLTTVSSTQMGLALFANGGSGALGMTKPFANEICLLEGVHVAGTTHVTWMDELAKDIVPGQRLQLRRDVENSHDKWAIKVLAPENPYGEEKLGFLPCDKNEIIARLMDGGKSCFAKVISLEQKGSWTKINIEVYLDD